MSTNRSTGTTSVARNGFWGVVSQASNSLGNVLLALMVARGTSPTEFGAWSMGFVGYVLTLNLLRALASTPHLLKANENSHEISGAQGALSLSAILSLLSACAFVLLGTGVEPLREAFLSFALVIPFVLQQDALRFVYFARQRPKLAAILDATWTISQVVGFGALIGFNVTGMVAPTLVWGGGAFLAALVGLIGVREWWSVSSATQFVRANRWASTRLLLDAGLVAISTHAVMFVLAAVTGLAAVGALRAGQTLLGGLTLLVLGLTPVVTVESIKELRSGRSEVQIVWVWTACIAVLASAYGFLLLLIPEQAGKELVGESWELASPLLLALILHGIVRGPFTGAQIVLRARYALDDALKLRVWTSIPLAACPIAGALIDGALGAAWGILAGALIADLASLIVIHARSRRIAAHFPPQWDNPGAI